MLLIGAVASVWHWIASGVSNWICDYFFCEMSRCMDDLAVTVFMIGCGALLVRAHRIKVSPRLVSF
ncbi:MAG: hypothetical protein CMM01_08090 [Rhodopirellula sp.]|nr:hypothetical protein [Rhodopirellula sp.]OUX51568.1 MAG: hypothetical protein CBE43_03060 [Rhodopirellula sp. TMED283]